MRMPIHLLCWLLLVVSLAASSNTGSSPPPSGGKMAISSAYTYRDTSQALSHAEIQQLAAEKWQYQTNFYWYYTRDPIWLQFPLRLSQGYRLLEIDRPTLSQAEIWISQSRQGPALLHQQDIDTRPIGERPLQHRNPVFDLNQLADGDYWVTLRLHSHGILQPHLYLWKETDLITAERQYQAFYGMVFGIMLVMGIYNLMLGLRTDLGEYRAYFYYTLSACLFIAGITGLGNQYLWNDWYWLKHRIIIFASALSFITALFFLQRFLDLPTQCRWLHRTTQVIIGLYVPMMIAGVFLTEDQVLPWVHALSNVVGILAIVAAIHLYRRRIPQAGVFLAAWSVLIIGTLVYTLMTQGFLPHNILTTYMQTIGFVLETVILSVGLANRLNHERQARQKETEEKLQLASELNRQNGLMLQYQRNANELLEARVEERTAQLQEVLQQLETLSNTDQLTGLYNRRHMARVLPEEMARAARGHYPIALLLIDIDHFKHVNDQFGHPNGDICLQTIAQLIRHHCRRAGDAAYRYGGEEFMVIFPHVDQAAAESLADSLLKEVSATVLALEGFDPIRVSVSIGVAIYDPQQKASQEQWIQAADMALYTAKHNGRNRRETAATFPDQRGPVLT